MCLPHGSAAVNFFDLDFDEETELCFSEDAINDVHPRMRIVPKLFNGEAFVGGWEISSEPIVAQIDCLIKDLLRLREVVQEKY